MSRLDQHPNIFRLLFGILAGFLLVLALGSFYRFASRPTDENLFTNPISNLYVTNDVPAVLLVHKKGGADSGLRLGDLIAKVGIMPVTGSEDLQRELAKTNDTTADIEIQRFSSDERRLYRVPKTLLTSQNVHDLGPTARVINVTGGGASDRAGMQVGDLILQINGQGFKNSIEADQILAAGQVGKALVYDVLRDNQMLSLHVTIAAIGVPFPVLVSTLCGLFFFGVGLFLGFVRPRYNAARLSGLFFVSVGFFVTTILMKRGYDTSVFARVGDASMVLLTFLSVPLSLHAGHYFPIERPELISRKWIRRTGYGLVIGAIILTDAFGNPGFFCGLALLVLYNLIITVAYHKHATEEFKRLNRVSKNASIVAGCSAGVLVFYLIYTLQTQDIGYMAIPLLLVPLSHLYTIGRFRLMGLDLRIRRNVQYILVTSAWVLMLGVLAFRVLLWLQGMQLPIPNIHLTATSLEVLDSPLQPQQRIWLEKGILMMTSVIVVYSCWKIAQRGQSLIDRIFFRSQYDYRRAANELAEVMATRLNMVDLARGMVEKLTGLLQLKRVGVLFFRDQRACCCQEAYGFDGASWAEFCLNQSEPLTTALQELETESNVDVLPVVLRNEFRKNGFLYLAAIRSKDKLVGALLVGEKRSETAFQQEDLDFLGVVAKQAAVAIENAFLYEELAEKERMKHELAIARRIQLASLPQSTPTIEGLEIAGASHPALEVGGDYFDYLNGEAGKITIIVGDVSGKGTSAALYMSKVQGILRSLHAFKLSPKELFVRTNHLLCNDLEKSSFVTAITGAFEPKVRKLTLARAGHLPLYQYRAASRDVVTITPRGLGLGLEATDIFSSEMEERTLTYQPNDVFVFASDGVTEAENQSGGQFGEENLVRLIAEYSKEDAINILGQIVQAVQSFAAGGEQHDDQTLVIVKAR
jgi:serine phosphatase RsbU (regulator of sigma subunit)